MSYLVMNKSVNPERLPRITLFGKGALLRCYQSTDINKSRHADDDGEYFTWHASAHDVLRHAYEEERERWANDNDSSILIDMDPESPKRVWIARLDEVYGVTYTKKIPTESAVNSVDWTAMMLRLTEQIGRFGIDDQSTSVVKESELRRLQSEELRDGKVFYEFLYVIHDGYGSWSSKPGSKNVPALYKSALSFFLQHIRF